jgi:hypothetical protein
MKIMVLLYSVRCKAHQSKAILCRVPSQLHTCACVFVCVAQSDLLGCSPTTLVEAVLPALAKLATVMDEICWADRLSPYNHTLEFPFLFTGTGFSL